MGNQWVWGLHLCFLSMFLVATKHTCLGAQNSTRSCHERERLALLEFKHSVKDDFKVLSSWVGIDCCSWKGVRCDDATGRVAALHLRGDYNFLGYYGTADYYSGYYYLEGDSVNKFIGSFKQLNYLNLSNTYFSGTIPQHIGNLSNLKVLDLGSIYMLTSNDMAWVSGLSSLEHLDLSDVDLSQANNVDMVFYMIPSLTYLSLQHCRLSNADLGLHLNSSKILPNIEYLDLSSNFFEGQLPHFFQNMTSLTFLDLSNYNLNLAWNSVNLLNIMPSLSELHLFACGLYNAPFSPTYLNSSAHSNIQYLDLSRNSIEGRFPSELMNTTSLKFLDLLDNSLNSSIPVMPNLLKLDVSYNKFEHIELVGIWRQCHLKELSVSGNDFGGEMLGPSSNTSECSHYALEVLEADESELKGSIPESVGKLNNLRVLSLSVNSFTGSIPKSVGKLNNLRVLSLNSNSFTGSIPKALERLRSLEVLDLSFNKLTGPVPAFLGKLTKLDLSNNQLSGSIPESLGRLTGLIHLGLQSNLLTGTIPVSLGQLTKLPSLDISNNSLEGVVLEAHLAKLSMLKNLDISSNHKLIINMSHEWIPPFQLKIVKLSSCKIVNGFPQWLQNQRKLQRLFLSNASLNGLLPTWLRNMPMLLYLDLSHNKLTGSLINLPFNENIMYLLLVDNLFNGSIPSSVCRRRRLEVLDVSGNQLSGNIPDCVGNLPDLALLKLDSNRLSGVLPSSLGNTSSLKWLKLNDNNFNGQIPQDLRNLKYLEVSDLGNNEFSGTIPKWIGEELWALRILRLHKNNFTGGIPHSLCQCSYLHILDVAHNSLTGSIPHCFGELSWMNGTTDSYGDGPRYSDFGLVNVFQVIKGMELEYTKTTNLVVNMDLSSNKLTGEIPPEITTLAMLMGINLSHNHLSGSIPDSIGKMKALNSIDFSDNQLNGTIPPSMAALNFLEFMNLSHNNLSGRIPTGNQLRTLIDPSMYAGNRDLCGAPLPNNCSNDENPPATTSKNKYKKANGLRKVWFYLDITCGFATGFWGIIGVLAFKKQWRRKLFIIAEVTMEKVYVAVAVKISKIKRGTEA
ncbi:putative non-specific serine/threonine protein kinase [Helianthus annuus]|nr:putative non-specific serine/threonine protein kinase [Helianthus annuus]